MAARLLVDLASRRSMSETDSEGSRLQHKSTCVLEQSSRIKQVSTHGKIDNTPGYNLIEGPVTATLILFALPALGSNILQSINASINALWVGQFLGARG